MGNAHSGEEETLFDDPSYYAGTVTDLDTIGYTDGESDRGLDDTVGDYTDVGDNPTANDTLGEETEKYNLDVFEDSDDENAGFRGDQSTPESLTDADDRTAMTDMAHDMKHYGHGSQPIIIQDDSDAEEDGGFQSTVIDAEEEFSRVSSTRGSIKKDANEYNQEGATDHVATRGYYSSQHSKSSYSADYSSDWQAFNNDNTSKRRATNRSGALSPEFSNTGQSLQRTKSTRCSDYSGAWGRRRSPSKSPSTRANRGRARKKSSRVSPRRRALRKNDMRFHDDHVIQSFVDDTKGIDSYQHESRDDQGQFFGGSAPRTASPAVHQTSKAKDSPLDDKAIIHIEDADFSISSRHFSLGAEGSLQDTLDTIERHLLGKESRRASPKPKSPEPEDGTDIGPIDHVVSDTKKSQQAITEIQNNFTLGARPEESVDQEKALSTIADQTQEDSDTNIVEELLEAALSAASAIASKDSKAQGEDDKPLEKQGSKDCPDDRKSIMETKSKDCPDGKSITETKSKDCPEDGKSTTETKSKDCPEDGKSTTETKSKNCPVDGKSTTETKDVEDEGKNVKTKETKDEEHREATEADDDKDLESNAHSGGDDSQEPTAGDTEKAGLLSMEALPATENEKKDVREADTHDEEEGQSLNSFDDCPENTFSEDLEDEDIEFAKQYEKTFEAFLSANPDLMKQNPEMVMFLRVSKLQKLLELTAALEQELPDKLRDVQSEKEVMTRNYQRELLEAAKDKACREIYLQQELSTMQEAAVVMEGRMKWKVIRRNEHRAKREVSLLQRLWDIRTDEDNPLATLPEVVEAQRIREIISEPPSSVPLTEEQEVDLVQYQVDNAFLNAEVSVLEKKLSYQKEQARKHRWVESVFRRIKPEELERLKARYETRLGTSF